VELYENVRFHGNISHSGTNLNDNDKISRFWNAQFDRKIFEYLLYKPNHNRNKDVIKY